MDRTYFEERTIVIKDLFSHIVSKVYWLLAGMVLFAAALPILRFLMQRRNYRIAQREYAMGLSGDTPPVMPGFPVLFIFAGAVIGVILAACVIAALYILSGRLKTDGELAHVVPGSPVLARLPLTSLTRSELFAEKLVYGGSRPSAKEEAELLVARLTTTCRNQGITHVLLGGSLSPEQKDAMDPILEQLTGNGIELEQIGNVRTDPQAICKLSKGSSIVLAETEAVSAYSQIAEELYACSRQQLNLLGFLVFA